MPADFDRYAGGYDDALSASIGAAFGDIDRFAEYKVAVVVESLAADRIESVLDFGCGVGRSLPFLARAFPHARIFGFDPSPASITQARARDAQATLTASWDEIPRGSFDCVFAANVFHHIDPVHRASALARCADALHAGGSVFVFEHNPYNPLTRWIFERCEFDRGASMITRSELIAMGRSIGLSVSRTRYTLFVPFRGRPWSALQRSIGWLPLGAQHYVQFTA